MIFTDASPDIDGPLVVEPRVFADERGFFLEVTRDNIFRERGIPPFVQDNHSRSVRGVLRGLHYQLAPMGQGKLVRCCAGAVLDVAVDIRVGSPSYGRWLAVELTENTQKMVYIPPGFAHGFYALSDVADVEYKQTQYYSSEHERAIVWNDAAIGIEWPDTSPILSAKDTVAPTLADAENNFSWVAPANG